MLYIGVSAFSLNSAGFVYHNAGVLRLYITDDMVRYQLNITQICKFNIGRLLRSNQCDFGTQRLQLDILKKNVMCHFCMGLKTVKNKNFFFKTNVLYHKSVLVCKPTQQAICVQCTT